MFGASCAATFVRPKIAMLGDFLSVTLPDRASSCQWGINLSSDWRLSTVAAGEKRLPARRS